MNTKLSANMMKTLVNLSTVGTVTTVGTLEQNARGCTANGLDALKRRGLIESVRSGEVLQDFQGRDYHPRVYRITDAGRTVLDAV
jgi:hypothetical protein